VASLNQILSESLLALTGRKARLILLTLPPTHNLRKRHRLLRVPTVGMGPRRGVGVVVIKKPRLTEGARRVKGNGFIARAWYAMRPGSEDGPPRLRAAYWLLWPGSYSRKAANQSERRQVLRRRRGVRPADRERQPIRLGALFKWQGLSAAAELLRFYLVAGAVP
jgi:hypothetical protein